MMTQRLQNGQSLADYLRNIMFRCMERLGDNDKPLIVVFTGSGISEASGIPSLNDQGGLWAEYDPQEVATVYGWEQNPGQVLEFYNYCRREAHNHAPNAAHLALTRLEEHFRVIVITQNVDGLHERAGSTCVIPLHGELTKVRGVHSPYYIYDIGSDPITISDRCEVGSPMRPHIVWFGDPVPLISLAQMMISRADCSIIVGTSLQVYPAAELVNHLREDSLVYWIDPELPDIPSQAFDYLTLLREPACDGVERAVELILERVRI